MKKNITINLCGRLFQIDEDAYELLKNYEEVLRRYFRKQEGGEEIAADLESRIAELLSDLKQQGVEAITIEHVQDIIRRIGRPEEISEADSDEAGSTETNNQDEDAASSLAGGWKAKRFYRDGERKMVAGVLAGLSNYFGGDVTLWRLGFGLLILLGSGRFSLFNGLRGFHIINIWGIVLYIIMAIIAPVAHTPEERLQMKGREVTPETLADEIRQEAKSKEEIDTTVNRQENDGCMKGFFSLVAIMFKIFLIFIGLLLFIPAIVLFCFLIAVAVAPATTLVNMFDSEVFNVYSQSPWVYWGLFACILVCCFIPVYCAAHAAMTMAKKTLPMGIGQRLIWLLLWLLSVAGIVAFGVKMCEISDEYEHVKKQAHIEENTVNGFYFHDFERDYMQRGGWQPIFNEHNKNRSISWGQGPFPHFTSSGSYYNGDKSVRYLDGFGPDLTYEVERSEKLTPGHHTLSYVARAEGVGAVVYVKTSAKNGYIEIPVNAHGDEGGNIWEEAVEQTQQQLLKGLTPQSKYLTEVNDGRGYGWDRYEVGFEVGADSIVTYAVRVDNAKKNPGKPFEWFSATDFYVK
mgnify:CR=1 FL=1